MYDEDHGVDGGGDLVSVEACLLHGLKLGVLGILVLI